MDEATVRAARWRPPECRELPKNLGDHRLLFDSHHPHYGAPIITVTPTLWTTAVTALLVAGCATPPAQVLDVMEPMAINAALERGRFELNCPAAEAALLSRELAPPAIETVRFYAPPRGMFTVGISGCGQRRTYQLICPEGGSGCFSADTPGNIR